MPRTWAESDIGPIERMPIALAMLNDRVLVSNDAVFAAYGVRRLW